MARQQRAQERAARTAALRRRRLIAGTVLALLVGIGLMLTVNPTVGLATGMLIALAVVWFARSA